MVSKAEHEGSAEAGMSLTADVFKDLIDAAPDAMVVVDGAGKIRFANAQMANIFGYERDELVGKPIEIVIPERFRVAHVGHRSQYANEPRLRPMGSGLELFGLRKDRAEFPIEISLSPLRAGNQILVCAAIRDISERKRMEAAAKRVGEYLRNAVESIQGAFALFDADDQLVLCNSGFRLLFGRDLKGEVTGRTYHGILDENIAARAFDLKGEPIADFRTRWLEYHRNPRGEFSFWSADGHVIRVIERRTFDGGTVCSTWDVTDDVLREEELRTARAAAEAASSAKSEFLSSMSHELRTPLNAILGFAQLLQRDKKSPLNERQLERLSYVIKGGEHLLRLIDDVLDLARIESGRVAISLEPVNVREVLEEVRATVAPMAERAELELSVEQISADFPLVVADRTRLSQILMNYASNAVKYGRPGGKARFRAEVLAEVARVTLTDDGIGVPADKQDKLFQPFHRAGQETGPIEGTGIGLAISKRLAEIMQGSVGFESIDGQGSKFWVELEIHREAATTEGPQTAHPSEGSALAAADGDRHVIVYIEDNPSNIAFMEDFFTEFERITLLTAPSAELGIEIVRAHRPDLVIMDINLPGISGFEAARRLKGWDDTREIPVIALSAAAAVRDSKRVAEAGFFRYLTKPVKVEELTKAVEDVLMPA